MAYLGHDYPSEYKRWPKGQMRKWIMNCPGVHISERRGGKNDEIMEAVVLGEEEVKEEVELEEERSFPEKAFCEYLLTFGFGREGSEPGFVDSPVVSFIDLYEAVDGLKEHALDDFILWLERLDYVKVCSYWNNGHADCICVNPRRFQAHLKMHMQPRSPKPEECRSLPPWRHPETVPKRQPFRPSSLETSRMKRPRLTG